MAEYIEREATVELLRSLGSRDYRREKGTIQDAIKMLAYPEYTPSADVAPVRHGRWIYEHISEGYAWVICSECEAVIHKILINKRLNYCPNCGAKMDGGSD